MKYKTLLAVALLAASFNASAKKMDVEDMSGRQLCVELITLNMKEGDRGRSGSGIIGLAALGVSKLSATGRSSRIANLKVEAYIRDINCPS